MTKGETALSGRVVRQLIMSEQQTDSDQLETWTRSSPQAPFILPHMRGT